MRVKILKPVPSECGNGKFHREGAKIVTDPKYGKKWIKDGAAVEIDGDNNIIDEKKISVKETLRNPK